MGPGCVCRAGTSARRFVGKHEVRCPSPGGHALKWIKTTARETTGSGQRGTELQGKCCRPHAAEGTGWFAMGRWHCPCCPSSLRTAAARCPQGTRGLAARGHAVSLSAHGCASAKQRSLGWGLAPRHDPSSKRVPRAGLNQIPVGGFMGMLAAVVAGFFWVHLPCPGAGAVHWGRASLPLSLSQCQKGSQ